MRYGWGSLRCGKGKNFRFLEQRVPVCFNVKFSDTGFVKLPELFEIMFIELFLSDVRGLFVVTKEPSNVHLVDDVSILARLMLSKFSRILLTVKVNLKLPEIPLQVEINPIEICTDWMIPFLTLGPTAFELHASVFETEVTNPRVHLIFHDSD